MFVAHLLDQLPEHEDLLLQGVEPLPEPLLVAEHEAEQRRHHDHRGQQRGQHRPHPRPRPRPSPLAIAWGRGRWGNQDNHQLWTYRKTTDQTKMGGNLGGRYEDEVTDHQGRDKGSREMDEDRRTAPLVPRLP